MRLMLLQFFGDEIWVVITVAEGGALDVTQAMFATSFQKPHTTDFEESEEHSEFLGESGFSINR